ncbi:hypothetical protein ACQEVF_07230 [Nonomuraea polychroma]|uniref:hypothetical protein n=1 Tax=Nonomuraea polychroma TaxID=46176 RepID=UPI003D8D6180
MRADDRKRHDRPDTAEGYGRGESERTLTTALRTEGVQPGNQLRDALSPLIPKHGWTTRDERR